MNSKWGKKTSWIRAEYFKKKTKKRITSHQSQNSEIPLHARNDVLRPKSYKMNLSSSPNSSRWKFNKKQNSNHQAILIWKRGTWWCCKDPRIHSHSPRRSPLQSLANHRRSNFTVGLFRRVAPVSPTNVVLWEIPILKSPFFRGFFGS